MRHLIVAITLGLGALISGGASAEVETSTEKEVARAVRAAVSTYRLDGMAGLIIKTEDCYATRGSDLMYCLCFDIASRRIDRVFVEKLNRDSGAHFPFNEYFTNERLVERTRALALTFDSEDEKKQYFSPLFELIYRRVDQALNSK